MSTPMSGSINARGGALVILRPTSLIRPDRSNAETGTEPAAACRSALVFLRALRLRAGHHRSARKPARCSYQRCRHAHGSALHALLGHLGVQANFFITRPFWGQDYKLPCAVGRHYCCVAEVYFTANPGAVIKASSLNDVHRAQ